MTCWLRENGVVARGAAFEGWRFSAVALMSGGDEGICEGRMDPVHLIPQQLLKRELGSRKAGYEMVVVAGCRKHHHLLDQARKLKIPRERLPESVEAFATAHNLGWYLDREYGAPQKKEDQAA